MQPTPSTILLVDESRFFLNMERQFLRNVPANVVQAQSAAEALDACRATSPQLIYLANELPDLDGASCCRTVKGIAQFAHTPVIMVYETAPRPEHELCREIGCDAVLTKPLERNRFLETGRKFLPGIRERRRSCLIGVHLACGNVSITGKGLDISSGGVFLETAESLELGAEVQLELHLARPKEFGPKIPCRASVAWANTRVKPIKPEHPVGYGIRFTAIDSRHNDTLATYLKALDNKYLPL